MIHVRSRFECLFSSTLPQGRHWFFGGNLIVDGVPQPSSLFKMVKDTIQGERAHNSCISFKDNSSVIRGYKNTPLRPTGAGGACPLEPKEVDLDLLLTAVGRCRLTTGRPQVDPRLTSG